MARQQAQLILDRYRVIKAAGSGGYATVLHARDTKLGRDVAIKRIELSEADVARARLMSMEARMSDALAYDPDDDAPDASDASAAFEASERGFSLFKKRGEGDSAPVELDFLEDINYEVPDFPEDPDFLDKSARAGANTRVLTPSARKAAAAAAAAGAAGGRASGAGTRGSAAGGLASHASATSELDSLDAFDEAEDDDPFEHIPGLQEARMVAKISDENIVHVYECEFHENTAYIIMEYVEGKTLTEVLREAGDSLTLDAVAAIFSSVAHALEVAHGSEILHFDIKPDNVMINQKGVVKVTDFGLATLVDASGHGTAGGGTIGYMPLEQMRQQPLDARTDQWSLAAMTYEMLSGSNPFFADTLVQAEEAIEEAELVLPSLCWDDMDPGIDDVIFKALDLEPNDRYETVADFADELMPYLGKPRKGKKELADLVQGVDPDPEPAPAPAPRKPGIPLMQRIGDRSASVLARLTTMLFAAFVAAIALTNISLTDEAAFGLASDAAPVFWGMLAAVAVASIVIPHVGALIALVMLSAALLANGAYLLGVAVLVVSGAWWWFVGRTDRVQPPVALAGPLFGAFGFGAAAPIIVGCFSSVGKALITGTFAVFLAFVFASFGSGDIMGWNLFVNADFSNVDMSATFMAALTKTSNWCIAASWILAALAYSLFCVRGTKAFDVAGAVFAAALLIVGVVLAAGVTPGSNLWLPTVGDLIGALVPGVAGIAAASMGVADRARWADEDEEGDFPDAVN